jgi:hypothetical protein
MNTYTGIEYGSDKDMQAELRKGGKIGVLALAAMLLLMLVSVL